MTMATLSTTHKIAAGECYMEVRPIIENEVRKFWLKNGGHYEDLLADASMAYLQGFTAFMDPTFRQKRGYDDSKPGHFEYNIRRWVWACLMDEDRVKKRYRWVDRPVIKNDEFIEEQLDNVPNFSMFEFLDELSEDAQLAARLVLETPADLAFIAAQRGGTDRNLRAVVRQHLAGMGWSVVKINSVFEEVKKALS